MKILYKLNLQMIEYCRLNIDYLRNAFIIKKIIKMTKQHAAQAPALRERHQQIFNFQ